jgi:hypothetical protein
MAQQIPALEQTQFGGVITSGNPLQRPPASSTKCDNFRVMPGNWLRLRSGRAQRSGNFNAIRRLHEVRLANGSQSVDHFWNIDKADGTVWWQRVAVNNNSYIGTYFEQISTAYGYTAGGFPAICNTRNRVMMYNGLGVRDGSTSRPALTQTFSDGAIRYVGLDAYCPAGPPTISTADGPTGTSTIVYRRDIYVGLYNSVSGHFGNGVKVGSVASGNPGTTTRKTTITLNSLGNLTRAAHTTQTVVDPTGAQSTFTNEANEIKTVFYATTDGANTPYLLIDTSGNPVTTTALSFQLDLDNLVASTTQEMPRFNFPPRPMSAICYANGRVYGVPMPGGSGSDKDFAYPWADNDMAYVCWSAAADDSTNADFVGIPEESWPLNNRKATPNGQQPMRIAATADGTRVLVITKTSTFLLEETADGLHTWYTVSLTSGIWDTRSFAVTTQGLVWFDQNKQIVMLPHGAMALQVLSTDYADLLKSPTTVTPGAYVLDPPNLVDRYQLWIGGGVSVCHDFALGGQAYTASGWDATAAMTLLDVTLRPHHIVCVGGIAYTQEGQPDNNSAVPISDEQPMVTLGVHIYSDFNAEYVGQWGDFGDSRERKEMTDWVIVGDAARSTQLADSPITLSWFADLDSTERLVTLKKLPQSQTDMAYQGKLSNGCKRWFKPRIRLAGHSSDAGVTYVSNAASGDLIPNVYGAIWISGLTVNPSGNR